MKPTEKLHLVAASMSSGLIMDAACTQSLLSVCNKVLTTKLLATMPTTPEKNTACSLGIYVYIFLDKLKLRGKKT